jgi:hypothetical protein
MFNRGFVKQQWPSQVSSKHCDGLPPQRSIRKAVDLQSCRSLCNYRHAHEKNQCNDRAFYNRSVTDQWKEKKSCRKSFSAEISVTGLALCEQGAIPQQCISSRKALTPPVFVQENRIHQFDAIQPLLALPGFRLLDPATAALSVVADLHSMEIACPTSGGAYDLPLPVSRYIYGLFC